ncbi:MAG: FRG domain-containing protein, partial [Gammaproteobacteria bacterium]
MYPIVDLFHAYSLDELIRFVLQIKKTNDGNTLYFRGENQDFGEKALQPSIYREQNYIREHIFYREMQRFNDHEFFADKTAFDKLARMQHYQCPTRMIDISEDVLSAAYFALDVDERKEKKPDSVLYVLEIDWNKIKYYDSDAVSVVANLAKTPLDNPDNTEKSKRAFAHDSLNFLYDREHFNNADLKSIRFLLHDIKEEKPYFQNLIDPKHVFSLFCVKPKYSNQRILGQKGAFLLFGLNKKDVEKPIPVFEQHASGENRFPKPNVNP